MTSKNDVLLTASDVMKWRVQERELGEKILKLQQQHSDLQKKLSAAEVFALPDAPMDVESQVQPNGHDIKEPADSAPTDSAPIAICANLQKTGESLKVRQIRDRLIELGFGEKIRMQPNFSYSLVYRLSQSGKLLKRGSKYRAPPASATEGEAEAVGASARQ